MTKIFKALSPFFILFCFLGYELSADIENSFPNGAMTRDASNHADNALGNLSAYSKAEVDSLISGVGEAQIEGGLKYYFTKTLATTGYRALTATAPAIATEAATFTVSATEYTAYTLPHVSQPLGVTTLPAGEITIVRFMSNNQSFSSGRNADFVSEVYFADDTTYANETFVATFTSTVLIGGSIQTIFSKATLTADTATGGVTRVMLVKSYWKRTGVLTSNNPAITVYCGGQYAGYITAQLPSAVVMRTNACNAVLPDARTCLDVYSKEESRVYTDTLATAAALAYHPINGSSTVDIKAGKVGIGGATLTSALNIHSVAGTAFARINSVNDEAGILLTNDNATKWTLYNSGNEGNRLYLYNGVYGDYALTIDSASNIASFGASIAEAGTLLSNKYLGVAHNATSTAHNATTLASEAYVTGYAAKLAGDAAQDFSGRYFGSGIVATNARFFAFGAGGTDFLRLKLDATAGGDYTINPGIVGENNDGITLIRNVDNSKVACFYPTGNASFSGDVRATSFTLGGNLNTGSNWISGDGDNEGIYVDGSGNVGIGTNTPATIFHAAKQSDTDQTFKFHNTHGKADSKGATTILFAVNNSAGETGGAITVSEDTNDIWTTSMSFFTNGNLTAYTPTERMRVTSDGEVLIATTTDAGDFKLQVAGNAYVSGSIQGAHVASDTSLGIGLTLELATCTLVFKDGLLVTHTAK